MTNDLVRLMQASNDIAFRLIASDGEVTNEIQEELKSLKTNEANLTDQYAQILAELKMREEFLAEKEAQIYEAKKSAQKAQEWLKIQLKNLMKEINKSSLEGHTYRLKSADKGFKVVVENLDEVPQEFLLVDMKYKPDTNLIRLVIEAGNTIPGVHLESSTSLTTYLKKGELYDTSRKISSS